jgi:transposase-like protein
MGLLKQDPPCISGDDPRFTDSDSARQFMESVRWPSGRPICPHCRRRTKSFRIQSQPGSKTRPGLWRCGGCRKQFTITHRTILEHSHIPLHTWLLAIRLLAVGKNAIGPAQLARLLGVTIKSALMIRSRLGAHKFMTLEAAAHFFLKIRPKTSLEKMEQQTGNLGL